MPPIKPEPIETSPELSEPSPSPSPSPDIKPEPIDYDSPPPSKSAKTLSTDSPSSKGKSIIIKQDHDNDSVSDSDSSSQLDTCGVCLLERGMSLRGYIDSCEHYFCFVCIMEWAKVESRCPVCKGRFSTIRRPTKDGVFVSERIVNVPVRNQIHYYNGNATIGPPDPYSQVKCGVCSLSSDDELLLLCDLCDSAAHSYCVGLGATVPEGDWFCKDCTLSRDEHAKVENVSNEDDGNSCPSGSYEVRFARSDVSAHDIVRETYTREPHRSSVPPSVDQSETVQEPSSSQPNVDRPNVSNARTLHRCANVHSRIQVLRENWEGVREGSFKFPSKGNQENSSSRRHPNSDVAVDKAWKMMDIATKALGKKCGSKSSLKFPVRNERLVNEASTVKPSNSYFQGLKISDSVGTSKNKPMKQNYIERDSPSSRKSIASDVIRSTNKSCSNKEENRNIKNIERELPSATKIIASDAIRSTNKSCSNKEENRNIKNIKHDLPSSRKIIGSNVIGSTDKMCSKKEENVNIKKDPQVDGNTTEVENAKCEIQSLVKLNLKLLSRHKKLDIDVFKEVARHSTHSIMAACGIEPLKTRYRSFERMVCNHNGTYMRPISTLMPTCCRECFFVFVKDVVTTITFDRTGSCKV